jgi:hypothetical protein
MKLAQDFVRQLILLLAVLNFQVVTKEFVDQ